MSDDRYRFSFEGVAEQYERARPLYSDEAVAWLVERLGIGPGWTVLDLAAGTGKLTRQIVALGAAVVAVEPGDEMRGVLERVVPAAEALAGTAEEIPLPAGSVDAVTVGQAFHWFRQQEAYASCWRNQWNACPDRDRVDAAVRQRDLLRRARERLHGGDDALEHAAHLVARLDGDDVGAERDECRGQLAGAGGEVEHARARAEPEPSGRPRTAVVGVEGPGRSYCSAAVSKLKR